MLVLGTRLDYNFLYLARFQILLRLFWLNIFVTTIFKKFKFKHFIRK